MSLQPSAHEIKKVLAMGIDTGIAFTHFLNAKTDQPL